MEVKLGVLLDTKEYLRALAAKEIPVRLSYEIAKMLEKIGDEINIFEEQRRKLVMQYGIEETSGMWKVKDENVETYMQDINELREINISLEMEKIPIRAFGEKINLSPELIIALKWLIE
jgi:hypothetical protein